MEKNLELIKNKIRNIGSAIMYSTSDTILKLPTQIVNTLQIDELGYLWFLVPRPVQNIAAFDRLFTVRLSYFKKGVGTSLSINGIAEMIIDPEVINTLDVDEAIKQKARKELMMLRVKIDGFELFEPAHRKQNVWTVVSNFVMEALFPFYTPSRTMENSFS